MMHPKAKLTDEQVKALRRDYLAYVRSYAWLAMKYKCAPSTAYDIVKFKTRLTIS